MRTLRATAAGIAAVLAFGLAACGDDTGAPASSGGGGDLGGTVTVFAAASLTESFTTLGKQFEAAHEGTTVAFNFAGSSSLATQIDQGAPADVFAAAATKNMDAVPDAVTPTTFAKNQLVIVVAKGNPAGVAGLADLARPGL